MTFTGWLAQFSAEDSPRGDLARDIAMDRTFPHGDVDLLELVVYLRAVHASDGAVRSLKDAWHDWLRRQTTLVAVEAMLDHPEDAPLCSECDGPLIPPHNWSLWPDGDGGFLCAACM